MKLLEKKFFDSRIKSANVTRSEKWLRRFKSHRNLGRNVLNGIPDRIKDYRCDHQRHYGIYY